MAASVAQEAQQAAIERWCAQARRGLGCLDAQGRQRLLRALVDEIQMRGRELEIRGVIPADVSTTPAARCGRFPGVAYLLVVPGEARR